MGSKSSITYTAAISYSLSNKKRNSVYKNRGKKIEPNRGHSSLHCIDYTPYFWRDSKHFFIKKSAIL